MEKLVRWLGNLLGVITAAIHTGEGRLESGAQGLDNGVNRETAATIVGLFYICIVGIIDLMTPRGMNFDLFYLFGCACVGWAAGTRPALLLTVAAGAFLYFDGARGGGSNLPDWVLYWNSILRLLGFAAAGWLAAEAGGVTRNLERTVQ